MNGVATVTKADALALQAAVDAKLGYPRDSVDIGGGRHMPRAACRAVTASEPVQHPTLGTWAVPETPEVAAVAGTAVALPIGASVQPLDATWFPTFATAVSAQVAQAEVL